MCCSRGSRSGTQSSITVRATKLTQAIPEPTAINLTTIVTRLETNRHRLDNARISSQNLPVKGVALVGSKYVTGLDGARLASSYSNPLMILRFISHCQT